MKLQHSSVDGKLLTIGGGMALQGECCCGAGCPDVATLLIAFSPPATCGDCLPGGDGMGGINSVYGINDPFWAGPFTCSLVAPGQWKAAGVGGLISKTYYKEVDCSGEISSIIDFLCDIDVTCQFDGVNTAWAVVVTTTTPAAGIQPFNGAAAIPVVPNLNTCPGGVAASGLSTISW